MSTQNIFEVATRKQLRFDSPKGALSVEQLWTLPLTGINTTANLDDIAQALYAKVDAAPKVKSFVNKATATNDDEIKFEVVKYILDTKLAERDAAQAIASRKEMDQKILAIVARKQDASLEDKSIEELLAMVGGGSASAAAATGK